MTNLNVTPEYLEKLAKKQDESAGEAAQAAAAAGGLGTACWLTHGVMSGPSNSAFGAAETARRAAGDSLRRASLDLAAKLRAAKQTYAAVDDEVGGNLAKQVRAK